MCNHDCLNCEYKDCIEEDITLSEWDRSTEQDKRIINEEKLSEWMGVTGEKARHERYRYRNPEKYKEKCRRAAKKWAEKNPDKIAEYRKKDRSAYQHEYYLKNKERIRLMHLERAQLRKEENNGEK